MDDKDTKDDKKEAPVFTLQTPVTELGIKQKCGNNMNNLIFLVKILSVILRYNFYFPKLMCI
jgi:hypothetical protein